MIQKDARPTKGDRVITVPNGKIICLDYKNEEDRQFVREAYGYEAEEKGWFREKNEYTKRGLFYGAGRYRDIK